MVDDPGDVVPVLLVTKLSRAQSLLKVAIDRPEPYLLVPRLIRRRPNNLRVNSRCRFTVAGAKPSPEGAGFSTARMAALQMRPSRTVSLVLRRRILLRNPGHGDHDSGMKVIRIPRQIRSPSRVPRHSLSC